jgi:glycosyltransferase involved in cell wall biosynthesis
VKIVHINRDEYTGGASRSAYRLHQSLVGLGHDSQMYVFNKSSDDLRTRRYIPPQNRLSFHVRNVRRMYIEAAIRRYDKSASPDRTFFSDDRTVFYKDVCCHIPEADVINLHWIADFLDLGAFFSWLPKDKPLVWTLHDMAAFTGGCCHAMSCDRFMGRCGACPQLGSSDESDLTREIWLRKQGYYSTLDPARFHVVTPSRWLGDRLKRSSLLAQFPHSVIPYGLDLEVFKPRDRRLSREVLGIPMTAKVILFVSNGLHVRLKGLHVLMDALNGMDPNTGIFFLSLGFGSPPSLGRFQQAHIHSITEDRLLSLVYSAADVFVLPSLADNLPNTMLESIASGTPVVAFDAGGIPDAVRPGVTGLLAKTGDAAELCSAIQELLGNDAKRAEMSANCRKIAVAEYSLELQANRYVQLYESMLTTTKAARAS